MNEAHPALVFLLAGGVFVAPWAVGRAADDLEQGRALYAEFCARCHGVAMTGPGPAQLDLTHFPKDQPERFALAVTRGTRLMPPVGKSMQPDEVGALWAYVTSRNR